MEKYVTQKSYAKFTKGVVEYMKRHSNDSRILSSMNDKLLKAQKEIDILKEIIGNMKPEDNTGDSLHQGSMKLDNEIQQLVLEKIKNAKDIEDIELKVRSIIEEQTLLSKYMNEVKDQTD